ncbi:MAG: SPOR domain-containing protein [Candidatus Omnitrophica bacterium]|nr:SPOR domain-containing protein [Candidatus Omnitrophota bacterium]
MSAKFQGKQEKDLFEQFQGTEKKVLKKTRFLIPRIKNSIEVSYENIIFLSIGLLIACIVFFSLGVEKGRREVVLRAVPVRNIGMFSVNLDKKQDSSAPVVSKEIPVLPEGYTLQLASFRNRGPAEQERDKLRKEGYSADVKRSGEYYQVYIGGFDKRTEAERFKGKFINKYHDCYVTVY